MHAEIEEQIAKENTFAPHARETVARITREIEEEREKNRNSHTQEFTTN